MRDSEILQAKTAARLLSGLQGEKDAIPSLKYPEPVPSSVNLAPKAPGA
ncbi:MAG: hypothetical protein SA339_08780 [Methanomassiliicoccus sp.]|nr:hypothetical protein [Methanomassiliicoccus sp.]